MDTRAFAYPANSSEQIRESLTIKVDDLAKRGRVVRMFFRKKPVVIEAVKWDGECETANKFIGERYGTDWSYDSNKPGFAISIPTLEGNMRGEVGDWIIKGVKGEFYPCKPDIFDATYELAVDLQSQSH
jgi:hypothetical protein